MKTHTQPPGALTFVIRHSTFIICLLLLSSLQAQVNVPSFLNYQGKVTDSAGAGLGTGTPVNRKVVFRIYDAATAGTRLWTEEQTATFSGGEFNVLLGNGIQATGMAAGESRPAFETVFNGVLSPASTDRYLELTVDNGDNVINASDLAISPRQRLTTNAYSFRARTADGIPLNSDLQINGTSDYGLGWYGSTRTFNGISVDGPVLYGLGGGALGSSNGGTKNIALQWNASGAITNNVNFTSGITGNVTGSGAGLTSLNASNLTAGTVPTAQIPSLDASKITSGTLSDARLSSNVVLQNSAPTFINPTVANLEVRSVAGTPYIDFSRTAGVDYNARIILNSDHLGILGNTTFYNNVGFGTTAPKTKAHVQDGSLWITGNWTGETTPNSNGVRMWLHNGIAHIFAHDYSFTPSQGRPLILNNNEFGGGRVGIGTPLPQKKLHVLGSGDTEIAIESTDNSRIWTLQASGNAGAGSFQIIDHTAGASRLTVDTNGRVGIGTITPGVPLDVQTTPVLLSPGGWEHGNSSSLGQPGGSGRNVSIRASATIVAATFVATSDQRAKTAINSSSTKGDLDVIQQLRVAEYRLIDAPEAGLQKGFIAQELEAMLPGAVSQSVGFAPDVYAPASQLKFDSTAKTLAMTLDKAHGFKAGEKIRLYVDAASMDVVVRSVPSRLDLVVTGVDQPPAKVFVYGREVRDFRAVDYNHVFVTAVGALQELKKEKDAEVKALQKETATLRAQLAVQQKELTALKAKDKARDAKLAVIEKLLLSADKPTARTVSLKQGNGAE